MEMELKAREKEKMSDKKISFEGKISILAPIETDMLGHRVSDVFEWEVPAGKRRLRVNRILYQPEGAGDYEL